MKRFLIVLAMLALTGTAAAQQLLSASEFREAVAARVYALAPDGQITNRDDLGITITEPQRALDSGMQLDRAFASYRADPSQLTALIEQWSHIVLYPPARGTAEANTPQHMGGLDLGFIQGIPTRGEVDGGNGLATSTLIEPGFCSEALASQHTHLVLDRGTFVFADAEQAHDFDQFLRITHDAIANGQSLSGTYLRCDHGHLVEWSPDQSRT